MKFLRLGFNFLFFPTIGRNYKNAWNSLYSLAESYILYLKIIMELVQSNYQSNCPVGSPNYDYSLIN